MELKPIRTDAEHADALAEVERLWDAPEGSAEADRLEVLVMLVEAYETACFPIEAPDPIDFLEYVMDSRALTRKDLEPYIGPRVELVEPATLGRYPVDWMLPPAGFVPAYEVAPTRP